VFLLDIPAPDLRIFFRGMAFIPGDGRSLPAVHPELRIELKAALAVPTLGILFRFVFAQFDPAAETIGAFQVGQQILDMTPLGAG
jgi:hypothetical protein